MKRMKLTAVQKMRIAKMKAICDAPNTPQAIRKETQGALKTMHNLTHYDPKAPKQDGKP